jgi:F0F1-type ATP synthase assembly protein I
MIDQGSAAAAKPRTAAARAGGLAPGEFIAWSVLSTLLAGPVLYGLLGWGVDELVGTTRVFLPVGILVGFGLSMWIVYLRYGRDAAGDEQGAGH